MSLFIERLESLAKERNVSIAKVLRDCNLGKNNMTKWKTVGSKPNKVTIKVLAEYFNVPSDYLEGTSNNRYLKINFEETFNLSKQEKELISTFRTLSISQQTKLVEFINSVKEN